MNIVSFLFKSCNQIRRFIAKQHTLSSWCRPFSSRFRSRKIRLLWISKFFCLLLSYWYRFYLKPHFDKLQFTSNHWWKFYSDQTGIKVSESRLKNISLASEKVYRNTLSVIFLFGACVWAIFSFFGESISIPFFLYFNFSLFIVFLSMDLWLANFLEKDEILSGKSSRWRGNFKVAVGFVPAKC